MEMLYASIYIYVVYKITYCRARARSSVVCKMSLLARDDRPIGYLVYKI